MLLLIEDLFLDMQKSIKLIWNLIVVTANWFCLIKLYDMNFQLKTVYIQIIYTNLFIYKLFIYKLFKYKSVYIQISKWNERQTIIYF